MQIHELALQRNKYRHLSDDEWRWFLQQEEGRQRTADKLPTFALIADWWYPVRLSCEQCSSEATARYKASLTGGEKMVDLTAGYGVDTYFLSEKFAHTDYVEQDAELCRIAEHNFEVQRDNVQGTKGSIAIHNMTAEAFLRQAEKYDLIYMDPARRDSHGGKVFRLEDCTPNVTELLPTLLAHLTPSGRIMLKLSPMLDITQALINVQRDEGRWTKDEGQWTKDEGQWTKDEGRCTKEGWEVHVVAVKNEVKEVLLWTKGQRTMDKREGTMDKGDITAIDLTEPEKAFVFKREEERDALLSTLHGNLQEGHYLYEPNAAILKAGAYKLVAARFGLQKLDVNTHLYVSDELVADFPGRVWQIERTETSMVKGMQANVMCRNYPLTPEQLKKKLHLRDGGTAFVIGCRVQGKPTVLLCSRVA